MSMQTESNSHSLLRGVAADQRLSSAHKQTITRKASGWIFGRWGAAPMPAVAESTGSTKSASIKSGSDHAKEEPNAPPKVPKLRAPGINQSGPIFGFPPEIKVHHPPVVKKLDQDELRNVLDEAWSALSPFRSWAWGGVHSLNVFLLNSFFACMVPTADFFAFGSDDTPNYTPRLSYVFN
jgi:hypothetical protein